MQTRPRVFSFILTLVVICLGTLTGCKHSVAPLAPDAPLSEQDRTQILEAVNSLANAWLAGDKKGVLAHYTEDAVLIPHHGEEPSVGIKAIERYWFNPLFPPIKVNRMDNQVQEISGSGNWAFVRGRGKLQYVFMNIEYDNVGNFFQVFRRTPEGWKIFRHVWTDPVPQQKQSSQPPMQ